MSLFSNLDIIIKENSDTTNRYKQLRKEINEHLQGKRSYKKLSKKAQDILVEWESIFKGGKVKESRAVLQVPLDYIRQDSNGYYLFSLPTIVYVQRLDGEPIDGKNYIQLTINEKGEVKRKLT